MKGRLVVGTTGVQYGLGRALTDGENISDFYVRMPVSLIWYHYRQNYLRAYRNLILLINKIIKGNRQIQGVGK